MSSQRQTSQPSQPNVKPTGIHAHPDDFYDPAKVLIYPNIITQVYSTSSNIITQVYHFN